MKISKKVKEIIDSPDKSLPTGYKTDAADLARYNHSPYKNPRDEQFIEQFIVAYDIDEEDALELHEYVEYQASKIMREHFYRVIEFFSKAKVPKVYILAAMVKGCEQDIVKTANRLGISKQAVHKHLRRLDPHFSKLGKFYSRQRNIKEKEPNDTNHQ